MKTPNIMQNIDVGIRPLVVSTAPHEGESLSSVLVRACEANAFTKTSTLLDLIGIQAKAAESVPFTQSSNAASIAALLGTTTDKIASRMHLPGRDDLGRQMVDWYGEWIERRHLEAPVRRFAPQSLEQREHVQAIWSVRLLDFCPVTMERLLSDCPRCSRSLGWRACRALSKCDKCGGSLLRAESRMLAPHLHDAAKLGAALVSPCATMRHSSLSSLPDPLRTWAPGDALEGIITLGEAQLWLDTSGDSAQRREVAACIEAGIDFAKEWPESLSKYVKAATQRSNSTSIQFGLGPLGRLFTKSSRRTPVRELVRSQISASMGNAVIPAKLHAGAIIDSSCRAGMLTALEATARLGIGLDQLRRLEGRSKTFLVRHHVKGGAALYDEAAILRLSVALNSSVRYQTAARTIGIPPYCVEALVTAGLIDPVNNEDASIVIDEPLVMRASIARLVENLRNLSTSVNGGVTLRHAMQRVGDPCDWVIVVKKLIAGNIRFQFTQNGSSSLSYCLMVRSSDIASHLSHRLQGPGIDGLKICCQTAADILGTTPQFVSAAVKSGFIDGKLGRRLSALSLQSVLRIQQQFVLATELLETLGGSQRTICCQLRKAGLSPATTINRTPVWKRDEIMNYLKVLR